MPDDKIIVNVLGVSNMSGLLEQSPNGDGILGNVQFVFDERRECDYAIIINQIAEKKHVLCDPNNIWAFMVEPAIDGFFDFTTTGHDQYAKVFTTNDHLTNSKYIKTHIITGWFFEGSYDSIVNHPVGRKEKDVSCISSKKSFLPGHKKRLEFVEKLKMQDLGIDFYGHGTNPINSKWDGLYPYKFSLAIENSSLPDYWTEKISDCFMAYTIPIYYGCTNIHDYFPEGSILHIDINDVDGAVKKIKDTISGDHYEKNLNALMEARNLYIKKYHFFPSLARYITNDVQTKAHRKPNPEFICLNPYKQSVARNIINIFKSQIRKFRD
jgi:hypothetical protein